MANDIFSRRREFGRSFTADTAKLSVIDTNNNTVTSGFAVQDMNFQYRQNIQKMFELGGPNFYYVVPPADGGLTINMLVGPSKDLQAFIYKTGNVCVPTTLTIEAGAGCVTSETEVQPGVPHMQLQYCVLNNLTVQGNAQNFIITSQVDIQVGWASFAN